MDTERLVGIFPKEIWSKILEHLTNLSDYYNICKASTLFLDVYSEHRIYILFPSVLTILVKQCAILHREKRAGATENNDSKDVVKWITFQDLIPLRQVCRSWQNVMDTFFQNTVFDYQFPNEYMSVDGQVYNEIEDYYTKPFGSPEDFARFRSYFKATHFVSKTNPFPARKVEIFAPSGHDLNLLSRFYSELISFLHEYGAHIWYFSIDGKFILDPLGQLEIYDNLKLWLTLLPNIKILWILAQEDILSTQQENQMADKYKCTDFPKLENLEIIDQTGFPVSMFMELLKKSNYQNLQQTGISIATKNDVVTFLQNSFQCPINRLKLEADLVKVSWQAVFDAINKQFGETLEQLQITLARSANDFSPIAKITLPRLRVLHLKVEVPVTLDFLLGVSGTLEKLELDFRNTTQLQFEHVKSKEGVVRLYSHLENLQKSNIWAEFPELKSVDVWGCEQNKMPSWSGMRKDWELESESERVSK